MILVLVVLASACRVEADVRIEVDEDGSGTVTVTVILDEAAAAMAGDVSRIRTQDLLDAGWQVEEPRDNAAGSVALQAFREVSSPEQLAAVLDEVGGIEGIFHDVELAIEQEFGGARYGFSARVELTGDPAQFSDPAVAESLGGLPLGRTPEELSAAGADDPEAFTLGVEVALPGGRPNSNGEVSDTGRWESRWEFPASGGEPTSAELSASSQLADSSRGMLLWGGGVVAVLGTAAGIAALVLRRD